MQNSLISQIPRSEFRELVPLLSRRWLDADTVLLRVEERADYVYFPENCIVGVINDGEKGHSCYIGLYGGDGFGSLTTVLGIPTSPNHEIVQAPGFAYQLRATDLRLLLAALPELRRVMLSYVHIFMMQVADTALAGHIRVEQRLARLLLMYQDRVPADTVAVTHQRLATMLGVRRSGITEAIHALEGNRLIRTQRGLIEILDRPKLIQMTEGSYGKPEAEHRRLI
jgi:CRP-like cAMP-binding protein